MSTQSSFSMKSTHRFITNDSETEQDPNQSNDTEFSSEPSSAPERKTNTENKGILGTSGSEGGMSIRTTSSAQEDYY